MRWVIYINVKVIENFERSRSEKEDSKLELKFLENKRKRGKEVRIKLYYEYLR